MPADEGFEDLKVERWGRYRGEPSTEQLIRFFTLTTDDVSRVEVARSDSTRLG